MQPSVYEECFLGDELRNETFMDLTEQIEAYIHTLEAKCAAVIQAQRRCVAAESGLARRAVRGELTRFIDRPGGSGAVQYTLRLRALPLGKVLA